MSVNQVYKATAKFLTAGNTGEMNFNIHYRTTNVVNAITNSEEAQEIADALVADILLNYLLFIPNSITFRGVAVIGVSDPLVGVIANANNSGAGGANALSFRSAPVVKLGTGLRGRSYNGRLYLMTVDESQQTGGLMLQTYIDSLVTVVDGWKSLTGLASTNEYEMTIYSPTLSTPGNIIDNIVQSVSINPYLGTQRSRQDVA